MSARVDEKTQFEGVDGKPIVNGYIYIGVQGADPKISLIPIYSDRALTIPLANPQRTDSQGRSVNKIWFSGRYSIKVEDVNNVQQFQDIDAGETEGASTVSLSNVLGANAITAEGSPTVAALVDKAEFIFQVAAINTTDAVTLAIDGLAAKAIKRNFDKDVGKGKFVAGQTVKVIYNASQDYFEWINNNQQITLGGAGADITAGAIVDLSLATGNSLTITGSGGPITSFGNVLTGAIYNVIFSGSPKITHNSTNLITPNSQDIQIRAGDSIILLSLGSGNWKILSYQSNYQPVGMVSPYVGTTPPIGWILLNGGTIGNASSGASNRANADTEELFTLLWNSMADAQAPVSSGRGVSAAADFAADKTITIPDLRGAAVFGTSGTDPATHGDSGGAETHTLLTSEIPSHTHAFRNFSAGASNFMPNAGVGSPNINPTSDWSPGLDSTGGDGAHNNMPPWIALSYICKL